MRFSDRIPARVESRVRPNAIIERLPCVAASGCTNARHSGECAGARSPAPDLNGGPVELCIEVQGVRFGSAPPADERHLTGDMPAVDDRDIASDRARSATAERDGRAGVDDDACFRAWRKPISMETRQAARSQFSPYPLPSAAEGNRIVSRARHFLASGESKIAPRTVAERRRNSEVAVFSSAAGPADMSVTETKYQSC